LARDIEHTPFSKAFKNPGAFLTYSVRISSSEFRHFKDCLGQSACVAYTARLKTISLWRRKMRIRRSMRKKPLRRPTKKAGAKRYRVAQQKKRLVSAGVPEALIRRMTNKDIRESLMKNHA
jgi:hypothetical protein